MVGETAPQPGWDHEHFRLEVAGLVGQPRGWSYAELLALPQQNRRCDIHCVTGWSRPGVVMRGLPLSALLACCGVHPGAGFVRFIAHSARGHDTSLPLQLALQDTWLVHEIDGTPLSAEHGGPLRTVTPSRYFYKSLKWLTRIELLAEDRPGYWERESAYHNEADPWQEQRFDAARIASAADIAALKQADCFDAFRGRVLLKARLASWTPKSLDFSGMQLKYCSLRRAQLAGASFRGANLSLSNFEGADLRGCDFSGADLEGASFAGADLREARMIDVALSATRFFRDFANGKRLAARISGMKLERSRGLLESQEQFLREHLAKEIR